MTLCKNRIAAFSKYRLKEKGYRLDRISAQVKIFESIKHFKIIKEHFKIIKEVILFTVLLIFTLHFLH